MLKKKTLKIIETILIILIILVCSISLLKEETIFGYRSYFITNNFKEELILVKETSLNEINKNDTIIYNKNNNTIKAKVSEKIKEEKNTLIKTIDNDLVTDKQIYGKYKYKFVILGTIVNILDNKIGFALSVLIPFITIIILEIINIHKDTKRKKIENTFKEQLDIIKDIDDNIKLKEVLENHIEEQLEKIKEEANNINKIEQTIQIPLIEIQKEIKELKKEKDLEDTIILFNTEDIKKEIEKELSTEMVDKPKKNKKNSTESVDKKEKERQISTESVDK